MRMIGLVVSVLFLQACATTPTNLDQPPRDFAVSLSIQTATPQLQPAWYVVQPDGVLRAVSGVRTETTPLPPIVRQLTPQERQRLWQSLQSEGWFNDPLPPGYARGPEKLDGSKVAALAVGGAGRRISMTVAPEETDALASLKSVEAVFRELSWLDQK
jgi:hypothetical protein